MNHSCLDIEMVCILHIGQEERWKAQTEWLFTVKPKKEKNPIVVKLWIATHDLEKIFACLHNQDSGCLLYLRLLLILVLDVL